MDGSERRIVGVTTLGHALVHTYELSIPLFVPVWLTTFDLTPATVGLIVTAGYVLFGLGSLPAGVLADRYGTRPLLIGCLGGMGVGFLGVAVAPGPLTLAATLVVWGTAASVYHPAGLTLISRGVDARGTALGYHGVAGNLGTVVGPAATILALAATDWRTTAALLTVPAFLGAVAVRLVGVPDTRRVVADGAGPTPDSRPTLAELVTDARTLFAGGFLLVFVVVGVDGLYYRAVLTFLPELLADAGSFAPITLGDRTLAPGRYLYAGVLTVGVVGQFVGGKLTDRIPVERGLIASYVGLTVVAVVFLPALAAGTTTGLAVAALLGLVMFGEQPFIQATVAEYSPATLRGLSYGFTYVAVFGVGALGATAAGVALTVVGPPAVSAILVVFALIGLAAAVTLDRRRSSSDA